MEDAARTPADLDRGGTWDEILDHVRVKDDSIGTVEWTFSINSANVRAHQHAAGARKKGPHDQVGRRPRGR